tara:strand:- start:640 stop:867 length:228 start_codon:yes stop_codon:yes gene_type:complete
VETDRGTDRSGAPTCTITELADLARRVMLTHAIDPELAVRAIGIDRAQGERMIQAATNASQDVPNGHVLTNPSSS